VALVPGVHLLEERERREPLLVEGQGLLLEGEDRRAVGQ